MCVCVCVYIYIYIYIYMRVCLCVCEIRKLNTRSVGYRTFISDGHSIKETNLFR